jgi:hypothetical protein
MEMAVAVAYSRGLGGTFALERGELVQRFKRFEGKGETNQKFGLEEAIQKRRV